LVGKLGEASMIEPIFKGKKAIVSERKRKKL
jgi:hypothetical protein